MIATMRVQETFELKNLIGWNYKEIKQESITLVHMFKHTSFSRKRILHGISPPEGTAKKVDHEKPLQKEIVGKN